MTPTPTTTAVAEHDICDPLPFDTQLDDDLSFLHYRADSTIKVDVTVPANRCRILEDRGHIGVLHHSDVRGNVATRFRLPIDESPLRAVVDTMLDEVADAMVAGDDQATVTFHVVPAIWPDGHVVVGGRVNRVTS